MRLKTYYPLPKFPPISLSGAACNLHCAHCDATYLGGMLPADTPEALVERCRALRQNGAIGALLSGGSDTDGTLLNLAAITDAIRQAKQETGLILNLHPGLIDAATAQRLTGAVDFASLDIPSDDVIQRVLRLDATTANYIAAYHTLRAARIDVVPHVTVYNGDEAGLLQSIAAGDDLPHTVVVIVFSPTRGTPLADVPAPEPEAVANVVAGIKALFPAAEISLGCMRPRTRPLREAIELAALQAGVARMELPSQKTLRYARDAGYDIVMFDACCALPEVYESIALRSEP
ncbi:MAG: radical SAM protein [Anaerolineae bacterium]